MKYIHVIIFSVFFLSCNNAKDALTAQAIVDRAIKNACNDSCDQATISYDFRGRHYISQRQGGKFQLERITADSLGTIRDVWNNLGFTRYLNDSIVKLQDSMAVKYQNSVNSVHYFAQLPFGLNDPAVHKELLGHDEINENPYYEIRVTFSKEEGGKDFEDVFVYWIHQKTFTVDYFAYEYQTDEGGIRFREAYNPRVVGGIRFVDYNNYKPKIAPKTLETIDDLFQVGELELLSKIENENIKVSREVTLPF